MNNQLNGHIVIVFALEHYNPLGLIRSLGENGINPIYFSIKRRDLPRNSIKRTMISLKQDLLLRLHFPSIVHLYL